MPATTAFVAYPSHPPDIGTTLDLACESLRGSGSVNLHSWKENDIPGRFITEPILEQIDGCNFFIADITRLNFNVTFEIGYAIGRKRRVVLAVNQGLKSDSDLSAKVGIFDTIGYLNYSNARELVERIRDVDITQHIRFDSYLINNKAPVYVVLPPVKGDAEIRLTSRVKKARLNYRSFDPEEEGRMVAQKAIDNIASSHGIIVHLLSSERSDAGVHNLRAAFVAGLATAMDKELLLMQAGNSPIPLDYRDFVEIYTSSAAFDSIIANYVPRITDRLQSARVPRSSRDMNHLAEVSFGASAAENEFRDLGEYYVQIDDFYKCKRGEIRVVAGRKGSGKTALFLQLRDDLRRIRTRVILDLKPEGFQLVKLKDKVLNLLEEGTRAHTVTAFWEYLLLIEICHKILNDDVRVHMTNHKLCEPYKALAEYYDTQSDFSEGDFAERMAMLIDTVSDDLDDIPKSSTGEPISLSAPQITELLHRHDLAAIRDRLIDYLSNKDSVWILFDNLDKGWPAHGLAEHDLLILRCLLDAVAKIERTMARNGVEFRGVVFIRNDVYELLVSSSPDRGKIAHAILDWQDQDALRELIRKRIEYSGVETGLSFEESWRLVFVSHIDGEETSQYLIDRCLMRPRGLIDLLTSCRSHAVNRGHTTIEVSDIRSGERSFSNDLVNNISFELQDVFPVGQDLLYTFLASPKYLLDEDILARLTESLPNDGDRMRALDLLIWYGFLGIVDGPESHRFIYDMNYSQARMLAHIRKRRTDGDLKYVINPAFWTGLEIAT